MLGDEDSKAIAPPQSVNQKPATTTDAFNGMDKVNSTVLKTSIEGIPLLTNDNYTIWRIRALNLFDLIGLKDLLTKDKNAVLPAEENKLLKSILVAKLDSSVQTNVINAENEDNAVLIWNSITQFFASNLSSNKARVFQSFLRTPYTPGDITGFITTMKAFQARLIEVGWDFPADGLGHLVLDKFPASMNNIADMITHSGKEVTMDAVLDHLRLHADNQHIRASGSGTSRSDPITLFTDVVDKRCKRGAHNTAAAHSEDNCWFLKPELRTLHMEKMAAAKKETTVSSFHSSISRNPNQFILDSGSSAHMMSDSRLFYTLDLKEIGSVQTSSANDTLRIKGIGSVKLRNKHGEIFLNHVLYIPDLVVNLLSVRCLVLEDYKIHFYKNSFEIKSQDQVKMYGTYIGNLPSLEFDNIQHSSHLSNAEYLHKSLGHVSYHRLRKKLGIPLKIIHNCESCAVAKVTRASFNSVHASAKQPFEEIHLDLIGPIWPSSREGHRYILTVVDSCTRFCAAIPIKVKSEVAETIAHLVGVEAKRLGYYPTTLHSDRGSEFLNSTLKEFCKSHLIKQRTSDAYTPQQNGLAERFNRTILESMRTILEDSGVNKRLWNEIAKVSSLTLNQIPTHKSKKSPFELFKGRVLPIDYFHPIGNRVSVVILPERSFSKLLPKGEMGILIGYKDDLQSFRILLDSGRIVETKNVRFLDYSPPPSKSTDWDLSIEEAPIEDEIEDPDRSEESIELEEQSNDLSDDDIASSLIPNTSTAQPVESTRVLRDRTLQIKPIKYTYLTADPTSFKMAMKSSENLRWKDAANEELTSIEEHQVWEDMFDEPKSFLHTTWIFKTKPSTLSAAERKKARLCIQGFSQVEGTDYGETFAPTGKFTTLLMILLFAIDKKLPIRQFDVKSAFLYAPLKEELYIKTPEGSNRKAPFLRLKKSLYGLKQAPANWYDTLTGWFVDINFVQSTSDPCLFIHKDKTSFIFFHVDDLVVVGNVEAFETLFLNRFPNSTAHEPDTLLGMDVIKEQDKITLSQDKLIQKGIDLLGLQDCKPVNTPLSVGIRLGKASAEEIKAFNKLNVNY